MTGSLSPVYGDRRNRQFINVASYCSTAISVLVSQQLDDISQRRYSRDHIARCLIDPTRRVPAVPQELLELDPPGLDISPNSVHVDWHR